MTFDYILAGIVTVAPTPEGVEIAPAAAAPPDPLVGVAIIAVAFGFEWCFFFDVPGETVGTGAPLLAVPAANTGPEQT